MIGVASALLAAGSAAATSSVRPSLRLVAGDSVQGANFVPHERVTIAVSAITTNKKASATKTVQTGARGGFTTKLPAVTVDGGCIHFEITATGETGDHATFKIVPACAPLLPVG
jgi:hypothetical protein